MLPEPDLPGARRRNVDILVGQHLGATVLVHTYCRNHETLPFRIIPGGPAAIICSRRQHARAGSPSPRHPPHPPRGAPRLLLVQENHRPPHPPPPARPPHPHPSLTPPPPPPPTP